MADVQDAQLDGQEEQAQEQPQEIEWGSWLAEQPDPVKQAYERHTHGLKSALDTERAERKTLAKQFKELAGKAEQGSELQNRLQETVNALEEAEAKAQFFEDAAPVVTNLRVAWMYARAAGLVDKHGAVDMARLRVEAPQLFERERKPPPGNAGSGARDATTPPVPNMNDFIRRSAGRK